jgi:glycosyltransferase involved in cell wall biosynthesis
MTLSTAVIIATKGRPREVSNLLDALASQTARPELIVVSACDEADIGSRSAPPKNVELIFGTPGSSAQRNRALSLIRGTYDIVVFLDDDFVPSRFWIERVRLIFAKHLDVGTVTGHVLVDGVLSGGIPLSEGQTIVNQADSSRTMPTPNKYRVRAESPYGCNMAFRSKTIDQLVFDERLVLCGWLEDLDFALQASAHARMIWTDLVWGVHLGVTGGRDSGVRFGYSQVVNPWYLMKKGTISPLGAFRRIGQGTAGNMLLICQKTHINRRGRLMGNMIGIKDIISGKWAPEKITDLS